MDKSNVRQMMRYVSSVKNLCLMMNLLRDNSRSIQYEAFHVFKVGMAIKRAGLKVRAILAAQVNACWAS
jgi:calcium binding protein 39